MDYNWIDREPCTHEPEGEIRADERRRVGEEIVSLLLQHRLMRHPGFDAYTAEDVAAVQRICGLEDDD